MINGAAHKPPRPSDCFSCSHQVVSFDPCHEDLYAEKGGVGLAQVLAVTLRNEGHKERSASRHAIDTSAAHAEDELEYDRMRRLSRSSRRRSSVVAAAIAATPISRSRSKSVNSPRTETISTRKVSTPELVAYSVPLLRHNSLADLPADIAVEDRLSPTKKSEDFVLSVDADLASSPSLWSNQSQGVRTPLVLDWASEPMPVFDAVSPEYASPFILVRPRLIY